MVPPPALYTVPTNRVMALQTPPAHAAWDPLMEQQSRALLQGDSASAQQVPSGPQKSSGVQQERPLAGHEFPRERQLLELELDPLLELVELELPVELIELEPLLELAVVALELAELEPELAELALLLEPTELVLLLELAALELLLALADADVLLLPPPQVQSRFTQVSPGPHSVVVVHWVWQIPPTQTSVIVPLQSLSAVQGPQVAPAVPAFWLHSQAPKMAVAANALPKTTSRSLIGLPPLRRASPAAHDER